MKRITSLSTFLIAASVILPMAAGAHARTQVRTWPPAQGLDLKQVALFKNGLGFFVAETVCPADRTDFRVVLPAAPSHGTFWIAYPSDVELAGAVAREVEFIEMRDAITIRELLEANQGRKVTLTLGNDTISGVIAHVARNREVAPPVPYMPGGRAGQVDSRQPWDRTQAGLALIETDSSVLCIDPRSVTRILFVDERVERRFGRPVKKVELDVRLSRPAAGRKLTLTFLTKGITWAPSYMVDISDAQKARLAAKAVILNDACQLDEVDVQLVTGFPHLQFSGILSPIAMKEDLAQFLQSLNRGPSERGPSALLSNVMYQSVAYGGGAEAAPMPDYGTAAAGTVAEDLFLYPAGSIDLDRNATAYVPLFTESVPYSHIYQWDIPDYVNAQDRYRYSRDERTDQETEQEIWHSLRLTNTTRVPWTTAPGATVEEGAILGQDTLKYTPPAGQTTLRVTRAVGIKADQVELETARQRNAMTWRNQNYDLVTIEGELSVVNTLAKPITLEITKTLSGQAKAVDPEASQEKPAKGLRRVNPVTRLTWTIELAPNAEKNLSYTYDVYVR